VSYKIGFDGVVTAELGKLLQSVENRANGLGIQAQSSDMGASTVASGSPTHPCPSGQECSNSVKGGQDIVVIGIAIVAGAVAGYIAGSKAAQRVLASVKGGQDIRSP
jgi:hypothetical protein